jgi:hypothetical protein
MGAVTEELHAANRCSSRPKHERGEVCHLIDWDARTRDCAGRTGAAIRRSAVALLQLCGDIEGELPTWHAALEEMAPLKSLKLVRAVVRI